MINSKLLIIEWAQSERVQEFKEGEAVRCKNSSPITKLTFSWCIEAALLSCTTFLKVLSGETIREERNQRAENFATLEWRQKCTRRSKEVDR